MKIMVEINNEKTMNGNCKILLKKKKNNIINDYCD